LSIPAAEQIRLVELLEDRALWMRHEVVADAA
jgi:hypothetical protein